jgi:hypothetical protein
MLLGKGRVASVSEDPLRNIYTCIHDLGSVEDPAHWRAPGNIIVGSASSTLKVKMGFWFGFRAQATSATASHSGLV